MKTTTNLSHLSSSLQKELDIISQEAISNPFAGVVGELKQTFFSAISAIADKINANIKREQYQPKEDASVERAFEEATKPEVERKLAVLPFMDFRKIQYAVPTGFHGNLLEYGAFLAENLSEFTEIVDKTIKPTMNLILAYLGDPEKLSNINSRDFENIYLYRTEIEKFNNTLNDKFFNHKKLVRSQPLGVVYKSFTEINAANNLCKNTLYPRMQEHIRNRGNVNAAQRDLLKQLDILLLRMSQGTDEDNKYKMKSLVSERIATLLHDVAYVVEFVGILQVRTDEYLAVQAALSRKLANATKSENVALTVAAQNKKK